MVKTWLTSRSKIARSILLKTLVKNLDNIKLENWKVWGTTFSLWVCACVTTDSVAQFQNITKQLILAASTHTHTKFVSFNQHLMKPLQIKPCLLSKLPLYSFCLCLFKLLPLELCYTTVTYDSSTQSACAFQNPGIHNGSFGLFFFSQPSTPQLKPSCAVSLFPCASIDVTQPGLQ